MALVEDLDAFLADWGVICSTASTPQFLGMVDQPDQLMDLQRVSAHSRQYELTYVTSSVSLARDMPVTVTEGPAAGSYTVREAPRQVDDGAFSTVLLSKV